MPTPGLDLNHRRYNKTTAWIL